VKDHLQLPRLRAPGDILSPGLVVGGVWTSHPGPSAVGDPKLSLGWPGGLSLAPLSPGQQVLGVPWSCVDLALGSGSSRELRWQQVTDELSRDREEHTAVAVQNKTCRSRASKEAVPRVACAPLAPTRSYQWCISLPAPGSRLLLIKPACCVLSASCAAPGPGSMLVQHLEILPGVSTGGGTVLGRDRGGDPSSGTWWDASQAVPGGEGVTSAGVLKVHKYQQTQEGGISCLESSLRSVVCIHCSSPAWGFPPPRTWAP